MNIGFERVVLSPSQSLLDDSQNTLLPPAPKIQTMVNRELGHSLGAQYAHVAGSVLLVLVDWRWDFFKLFRQFSFKATVKS